MPNKTNISWCDLSSNPLIAYDRETGKRGWFCTKVSSGCQNCYAEKLNMRFGNRLRFTEANRTRVEWRLNERELEAVVKRQEPARIFWEDMGDMFLEDIPEEFLAQIWATMALSKQHTHLVLTKRPARMKEILTSAAFARRYSEIGFDHAREMYPDRDWSCFRPLTEPRPLPNLCAMTTAENQHWADIRIPKVLEVPAGMHGVSCEPLLGPIDLTPWLLEFIRRDSNEPVAIYDIYSKRNGLDWVIVGGESGGPPERRLVRQWRDGILPDGSKRREPPGILTWEPKPEALQWVRSLRDQCQAAGVPFHFKQWGPKAGQGTVLDGREWQEMPT